MFSIDLLRAIAILLITNSHLEPLYPVEAFATGGMFGNELFFFLSGYGLTLSLQSRVQPFGRWMARRTLRVYEPLVLVTTLMLAFGYYRITDVAGGLWLYTGFQDFWFLPTIVLFYVPLYFVITARQPQRATALAAVVALAAYVAAYLLVVDHDAFTVERHVQSKAPFYFLVMLGGIWAARAWPQPKPSWRDGALLLVSSIGYVMWYLLMRRYDLFALQFVIHLVGLVWLIAAYRLSHLEVLERLKGTRLGKVVVFLSGITLQMYLLQKLVYTAPAITSLGFPLGVLAFWAALLPAAWLFSKVSIAPLVSAIMRRSAGHG